MLEKGAQAPQTVQLNESKGYYEVGKGIRGARTDQELVDAIIHREHNTVISQTLVVVTPEHLYSIRRFSHRISILCRCLSNTDSLGARAAVQYYHSGSS